MKTCETCRWWDRSPGEYEWNRDWKGDKGQCQKIAYQKRDYTHHPDGRCEMRSYYESEVAYLILDDSAAWLLTDKGFGCVLHEPK